MCAAYFFLQSQGWTEVAGACTADASYAGSCSSSLFTKYLEADDKQEIERKSVSFQPFCEAVIVE